MKYLLAVVLLLTSARAWSCTCFGTSPINETIAILPNLVEAQVMSVSSNEATLRITRILKGAVTSNTIVVGQWMCYASLYPQLMKPQHTYVLPLGNPAIEEDTRVEVKDGHAWAIASIGPKQGEYQMPGCAESGFELVDGKLYTFEPTTGAQRRLQRYGDYSHFMRWRPVSEALAMVRLFLFLSLVVPVERLGPVVMLIVLGSCVALAVMFVRLVPHQRRRLLALIVALPAFWILIGLWGSLFRYPDLSADQPFHEPVWESYPPLIGLILFLSFAAIYIRRLPAARFIAVGYSLANAYFAVMMCLCSIMVVNGVMPSPWM